MSSQMLGLLELLLIFGAVLWFGWSQLRALKKRQLEMEAEAKELSKAKAAESDSTESS